MGLMKNLVTCPPDRVPARGALSSPGARPLHVAGHMTGDSPEVPRRRESGVLDTCARQILRYAQDDKLPGCHPLASDRRSTQACCSAQDDKLPGCHPERSEGSLTDLWGITRHTRFDRTLRMTSSLAVILSVAKDLWRTYG